MNTDELAASDESCHLTLQPEGVQLNDSTIEPTCP